MNKVTRTDRIQRPDWILGGNPEAIVLQEKSGQNQLVNSDILPSDCPQELRVRLETLGVKFLGKVQGDEIFENVELPKGWKKEATDHDMWSKLLDDKGAVQAQIFYKAAFYDRHAFMR